MKRYIVFAFDKDGVPGGHRDIVGFANTVEEIVKLTVSAQNNALINPNVIEVYDPEEDELIKLYAINADGNWIEHALKN
ncbi:hypothetical protein ACRZU2_003143 [Klebsiella variicola]